jgi:hypothetical protein
MSNTDGGPAFPVVASGHVEEPRGSGSTNLTLALSGGMSLRDWFAGEALKGGADSICDNLSDMSDGGYIDGTPAQATQHAARHAKAAYLLADAMLAERTKGREENV